MSPNRSPDDVLRRDDIVAQQYLEAGLVDEIQIHLVPILLGGGIRLFESLDAAPIELERTRVIESTGVTHLRFDVTPQK